MLLIGKRSCPLLSLFVATCFVQTPSPHTFLQTSVSQSDVRHLWSYVQQGHSHSPYMTTSEVERVMLMNNSMDKSPKCLINYASIMVHTGT